MTEYWDTHKKTAFILESAAICISVRYDTHPLTHFSSFKVVPLSFEYGLVLWATLVRGGGGSQAQGHKQFFVSQEMMERALMKQRAGIVQKQVAAGREFKVSS